MPILALNVPASFVDGINRSLRRIHHNPFMTLSVNDMGREALTRLEWEIDQILAGRAIVATNLDRTDLEQLSTPAIPARPPLR